MKMRTLLLGLMMAGLAQSAAHAVSVPDTLELMMQTGPDSPDLAVIKVDGEPNGRYNKVLTDTLEYDVYVRGDRPDDGIHPMLWVQLEDNESIYGRLVSPSGRSTRCPCPIAIPRAPRRSSCATIA